jgi:hypothetical protein
VVDPARERLNKAMTERMRQLRLKWADVARRADGMSQQHLLRIRKGQVPVTPEAAASIERALEWAPGSVVVVCGGGEATVTAAAVARPRWQSYRLTAEEALAMLQVALGDYGPGGFWREFDFIFERREDTDRTSTDSRSNQEGRTA